MNNRRLKRLSGFCLPGLALAVSVATMHGQNAPPRSPQTPPNTPAPAQTPPTQRGGAPTPPSTAATQPLAPGTFLTRAIEANSLEIQLSRLAATNAENDRVKSYAQMLVKDHTAALERLQKLQGNQSATGDAPTSTQGAKPSGPLGDRGDTTGARAGAPGGNAPQTGPRGTPLPPQSGAGTLPRLNDEQQKVLSRVNGLKGSQFDREYIDTMVRNHRESIRMFEQQSGIAAGDNRQGGANAPGQAQPDTRSTTTPSTAGASASEVAALARELLPTLRQHLEQAEQIQKADK